MHAVLKSSSEKCTFIFCLCTAWLPLLCNQIYMACEDINAGSCKIVGYYFPMHELCEQRSEVQLIKINVGNQSMHVFMYKLIKKITSTSLRVSFLEHPEII